MSEQDKAKQPTRKHWRDPFGKADKHRAPFMPDGRITIVFNLSTFNLVTQLARSLDCSKSEVVRRLLSEMVGPIMGALEKKESVASVPGFKFPISREGWNKYELSLMRGPISDI